MKNSRSRRYRACISHLRLFYALEFAIDSYALASIQAMEAWRIGGEGVPPCQRRHVKDVAV